MKKMNLSRLTAAIWVGLSLLTTRSQATSISLTNSDSGNPTYLTSSFTAKGFWNSPSAPVAGTDYYVPAAYSLRTPSDSTNYTFLGNSLVLAGPGSPTAGGGRLIAKESASTVYTVNQLVITNVGMIHNAATSGDVTGIAGNIVTSNGGWSLLPQNGAIVISANVAGNGPLWLGSPSTGSGGNTCTLMGSISNWTGAIYATNYTAGLILSNGLTQTFAGSLNMAAANPLTIQGSGVLTLTGTNTYWGTTTLSAGTLVLAGNEIGVTNILTVASGANLTLQATSTNTFSGTNYSLGNTTAANVFNHGSVLALLADSSVTFNGGNNLGGVGNGANTWVVNQLTGAGTGNTLTFAPAGFNVYNSTFNVSGGNGYTLALGTMTGIGTGGTLALNASNVNLTVNGIAGNVAGGITVLGSSNTVIGAAITATGALTKQGTGTLTLNGANTYTGSTLVQTGTVVLASGTTLASTNLVINSGATLASGSTLSLNSAQILAGNGTVNGSLDTAGGGVLFPGGNLVAGTLTVATNLTLSAGGTLNFDLAHNTVTGSGSNDLIVVGGTLNVAGATTLNLNFLNGSPATGVYTLFQYGAFAGSLSSISLATNPRYSLVLSNDTVHAAIELVVVGVPGNLVWVGDGSVNGWDNAGSYQNWTNGVSASPDYFYNGDNVTFNDNGSNTPAIDLTTVNSPGSVTVNASHTYDFTGSGSLSGVTGLVKSGTGTLILETANTYTGSTVVNGGTLQIGNSAANGSLGTGPVTNNGTLAFDLTSGVSVANDLHGSGTFSYNGPGSVTPTSTNIDYSGPTFVNSGILYLVNSNALGATSSGTTVASGGQIYITANVNVGAEALTLGGVGDGNGALRKGGAGVTVYGGALTLATNTTIGIDTGSTLTLTNAAGIAGAAVLTKIGGGTLVLDATNTYTGGTVLGGGVIDIGTNQALGTGAVTADSGGHFLIADGLNVTNAIEGSSISPGAATGFLMVNDNTNGTVTTLSGPLALNSTSATGGHFIGPVSSGYLNVSGPLTMPAATPLIVRAGNLRFSGGSNSYYTEIQVRANTTSLGANNGVNSNAVVDIGGNGTAFLDLNGYNQTLLGLKNTVTPANVGWVTNSTGTTSTLTLNEQGNSYTFAGGVVGNISLIVTNGSQTLATNGTATSGRDTYTGNTTIAGGTLYIGNGVIWTNTPVIQIANNGTLDVSAGGLTLGAAQTLNVNGYINGYVTNNGTLTIGSPGVTGSLTAYNNLTLTAPATLVVQINKALATSDTLTVSGTANYAGTLAVTNLAGTLVAGDSFPLVSAGGFTGNFTAITGSPGSGLLYSFNPTNGVLSVVPGVATNPTNLTFSVTGNTLSLAWPADHLGWRLLVQTNNLATGISTNTNDWTTVSGSASVDQTNLTINPSLPAEFYQLVYP